MITQDTSRWPLVVFVSRDELGESDFDAYLAEYSRLLAGGKRYAAVFDAREAKPLDVKLVKKQARWMDEHEAELKRLSVGIAFVIPSPMIRGVLRAILWLRPMPQPYNICETMPSALDWTVRRLRQNGLPVPEVRGLR